MIFKTNRVKKTFAGLCLMSAVLLAQSPAFSAATLTIQRNGAGDYLATLSGTINTAGLTRESNESFQNLITPSDQRITLGVPSAYGYTNISNPVYSGISCDSSWGNGLHFGGVASGDEFLLWCGTRNRMMLPVGYQSGSPISASATYREGSAGRVILRPGNYTYTWGTGANSDSLTVSIPAALPTVYSVSPNTGSTAGGTAITITGTDLTGATAITVGGAACTSVVASATSATCTTPAGTAGRASVLVTTSGGTNAANTLFTYETPVAAPIPTLSEWAMILLASLMGMFAYTRMRRQK